MSSAEDNNHPAAIDDQSHLLQRTGSRRFLVHSSAPSATTEGGNVIHLVDETAEELSAEVLPTILSFLTPKQIMRARGVCTTWRDAAKKTLVPLTKFKVDSVRSYNAMRAMSTALPNLQQLSICHLDYEHKYSDGEDPDEEKAGNTANYTAHDIDIISNFTNLRILEIDCWILNGRYPVLFNFPLLQKLSISGCQYLKWDLEILEGLPSLKELMVDGRNSGMLSGNINCLRVLKDTLEKVTFCPWVTITKTNIEGNFMDLADFPRLKALDLRQTNVTGDIRDIRGNDFPALERLFLPESVHGGIGYEIQHASDVPSLMHAIHLLLQRNPDLFEENGVSQAFYSQLSVHSVRSYNAMRVMSTALPTLQHLTICGLDRGHIFSDGEDPNEEEAAYSHDIDIISNFTNLRSLDIYHAPLNGRYPVLFNFPLLQQLRIRCEYLKWDLEMLAGLPSLKEFHCNEESEYRSGVNVTGNISSLRVLKETLEIVSINKCWNIEGNLMDLADFPHLKELDLQYIGMLSGNINCLRGLKGTLEKLVILCSYQDEDEDKDEIRGNFMDLADFPRLKVLDLRGTAVTGDIRDICGHDFPALERLFLPASVHGGQFYEFQSIAEVPSFMHAIHLLLQRNPMMFWSNYEYSMLEWTEAYFWRLSQNSPDWYEHVIDESESDDSESDDSESDESELPPPPFELLVVRVGSRLGWCWALTYSASQNGYSQFCEINWLDPEPSVGSVDYEGYIEELRRIEQRQHRILIDFYRGYHQPPTRKEYRRLCDRYWEEREDQILNESDVEDQILNESDGEVLTLEVLGNERTTVTQEGDEVGKEEKGEFEEDSKEGQANQAER